MHRHTWASTSASAGMIPSLAPFSAAPVCRCGMSFLEELAPAENKLNTEHQAFWQDGLVPGRIQTCAILPVLHEHMGGAATCLCMRA